MLTHITKSDIRRAKKKHEVQERIKEMKAREEYFVKTLQPAIRALFTSLIDRGELQDMRIKRIWGHARRLVIHLSNVSNRPYSGSRVWITPEGEVVIKNKLFVIDGYAGVGCIQPNSLRCVASIQPARFLPLSTQERIYEEVRRLTPH